MLAVAGEPYTLSGCAPIVCTTPSSTTGYSRTTVNLDLSKGAFDVRVSCAPGYGSNPLNFHQVVSEEDEPLLQENPSRFVIFPISDHEVWARYKHVESRFWNAEEIETENDAQGTQQATLSNSLGGVC